MPKFELVAESIRATWLVGTLIVMAAAAPAAASTNVLVPHSFGAVVDRLGQPRPGFWELYGGYALATASVLILQLLLIGGLLVERARRRRAERSLRESEAALRTSTGRVRDLAGRLIAAQEEERRRVATELHDDLGQELALLSIELEQLERRQSTSALQPSSLRAIVERVAEIATAVHEISHRLHPARLELMGLSGAIRGLCRDVSAKHGLEIDFREDGLPAKVDVDITICLYRVIQEALRNVIKHSGASEVTISLSMNNRRLLLYVADCGMGFDVEGQSTVGLGLMSMRERVHFLQGRLVVHSERGEGTIVFVEMPCSVVSERSAVA